MSKSRESNAPPSKNYESMPLLAPSATAVAYGFLRQIGFVLDELSAQGLVLWLDADHRWQWRWQGTDFQSSSGFWAIGEAVVDAVCGRFPETFAAADE